MGSSPQAVTMSVRVSLGSSQPVCRLLTSVLRRRAKPARTVRQKAASDRTCTGGAGRVLQWMTADVTLGAGRKQVLGTVNSSSGWV